MNTLVIDQRQVAQLLPMSRCIAAMEEAFRQLANAKAHQPLRSILWLADKRGALGTMPGYMGEILGLKTISVFPGNHGSEYDSHQGVVLLFEAQHGRLQAIIDASSVTAIRTAAASGLATRLLARENAKTLAILGSGVQASSHLEAMLEVRAIEKVRVWSRHRANAESFAESQGHKYKIAIEAVDSAQAAIADMDIICLTTAAREPVIMGEWLAPGTHINAVGACTPDTREVDTAGILRSRLYTDSRESLFHEAGDFLIPHRAGDVGEDHLVGELAAVLAGWAPGRETPEQITLFKSLGIAVEDIAAASVIYQQAQQQGIGLEIALGGKRDATT